LPTKVANNDELYLTGLHLEQYRHATRAPEDYWREALRRDPGDSRCHLALGRWHLRRGEFAAAEKHLRASIARLTHRNPNPVDGEAFYQLGLCLRQQALAEVKSPRSKVQIASSAYDAFYKSTWNQAWQPAGFHALAEMDCARHDWTTALDHLDRALRLNTDNLRARNLKVMVLRQLGRETEAAALLTATLALDPLDWWARHLDRGTGVPPVNPPAPGQDARATLACDTQTRLDLVLDHVRAGFHAEALALLAGTSPRPDAGTAPLVSYYRAWICQLIVDIVAVKHHLAAAAKASPDYCFPAQLEEIAILEFAIATNPRDARAPYYLGNLLYDRRRHREAIKWWELSARLAPAYSVVWRNLGIGYFNVRKQPGKARAAYDRALRANPTDARLVFERDQLWKRLGVAPARRLRELERHCALVATRDDLAVELCALLNQTGRPRDALAILAARRFQPWEGGEGGPLAQHTRAHQRLGRAALGHVAGVADPGSASARPGAPNPGSATPATVQAALAHFQSALSTPENLGEARHLLANQSDIHFWLGEACTAAGDRVAARAHWLAAATFKGDFQEMSVRSFSEQTYYCALALQRLGRRAAATKLLRALLAHARELARTPATIDYFATSLPTMLLFDDDLQARQTNTARFMEAQARLGLRQHAAATRLLRAVLARDPAHAGAADLMSGSRV
jgi:tetratricopeptide (TPR) repeat protein